MKIEIESRKSITARARKPFSEHTALISIADTDADFAILKNKPKFLLQMKFDDISAKMTAKFHMIDDEQAVEIAAFVESILDKAEVLICQYEYGQSRSTGIAAAVKQFLFGDGSEIFADDRYYPNKLVYRKVFEALGKGRY